MGLTCLLSTLTGIALLSGQVGSFLRVIRHALGCYDALQGGVIVGFGQLPTIGRRGGSPAIIHSPSELRSHARRGEKPINFARLAAGALQRTVTGLTNRKSTEPMPDEAGDAALSH